MNAADLDAHSGAWFLPMDICNKWLCCAKLKMFYSSVTKYKAVLVELVQTSVIFERVYIQIW